jgi:hypothetical protein
MPAAGPNDPTRAIQEQRSMASRTAERRKQRYAEDPVFREKVLATNSAWADRNRDKINARQRLKYQTDPEHRERICAESRANRPKHVYGLPTEDYERMLASQGGVCKIEGNVDAAAATRFEVPAVREPGITQHR